MNTLVLFDIARRDSRQKLESLLRGAGFVWVFPFARWSSLPLAAHLSLITRVRARLRDQPYRIVFIEVTADHRRSARWVTAAGPRPKR